MVSDMDFGLIILRERGDGRYKIIGESWGIRLLHRAMVSQG